MPHQLDIVPDAAGVAILAVRGVPRSGAAVVVAKNALDQRLGVGPDLDGILGRINLHDQFVLA